MRLIKELTSKDNTRKLIFDTSDGFKIESVILFLKNKVSLCLSSQVGCRFGCSFCRTGKLGFTRNLTSDEILEQYLTAKQIIKQEPTSIVFMGMGEPLDNIDNVISAIKILNIKYNYSQKRITVSTCGIPDGILRLAKETSVRIAISLNATDDETRNKQMPINKKYPISELIKTLKQLDTKKHKEIMLEYILIKDVNDKHVERIVDLFKGIGIIVNLIPYNECANTGYTSTDMTKILLIKKKLIDKRVKTFIRENKGTDISAACGSLG